MGTASANLYDVTFRDDTYDAYRYITVQPGPVHGYNNVQYSDQLAQPYQWSGLSTSGMMQAMGMGVPSPSVFMASTPKRTIERLRDEIKDWHGDILERNK